MDLPHIEIVEQPAPRAVRFRYESEGRPSANLVGVNSTKDCQTFPKIRIYGAKNYQLACLLISCVTKDAPYRNHPYSVANNESEMNDNCINRGIIRIALCPDPAQPYHEMEFNDLRLQCVKKTDVKKALEYRKKIGVDPFRNSTFQTLDAENVYTTTDLNALRLCFQVFFSDPTDISCRPCASEPAVSDIIYDRKTIRTLKIEHVTPVKGSVRGGTSITIICDKVTKGEIETRFFQLEGDEVVWEAYVDPSCINIYKQTSITFKTPGYHTVDVSERISVYLELVRTKDGEKSTPVSFELLPIGWAKDASKRKRSCLTSSSELLELVRRNNCACIPHPVLRPDCSIHGFQKPQVVENERTRQNNLQQCSSNPMNGGQVYPNVNSNSEAPREPGEENVELAAHSTTIHHYPQNQQHSILTASLKRSPKKDTNSSDVVSRMDSEVTEALTNVDWETFFKNEQFGEDYLENTVTSLDNSFLQEFL